MTESDIPQTTQPLATNPAPAKFAARYLDGKTARAQDVMIEIAPGGVSIYRGRVFLAAWGPDRLVLAEKPRAGDAIRIGLEGTTARLVVEDSAALTALLAVAPGASRRLRTNRRAVLKVSAWTVAALAAVAAIVLVLIPLLSEQLAAQTPDRLKRQIGAATLEQIIDLMPYLPNEDKRAQFCTAPDGVAALRAMVERITSGMDRQPELRITVLNANLVNAFALPGGYVIATAGLLKTAGSAEEVAGVIAHEIGHVVHAHPTQAIFRTTAVSLLISAVIGDFTGGVLIAGIAEWALNNSYSRDAEREADAFAITRLNAVNIDARGLERFFARIIEERKKHAPSEKAADKPEDDPEEGALRFLSSHPPTTERMTYIRDNSRGTGKALSMAQWADLRGICEETSGTSPVILIID